MQNLVIAADAHISEVWDKIDSLLAPTKNFLNPNRSLEKAVRSLGANDAFVVNGDLVDYEHADYFGTSNRTNWDIFFKTLAPIRDRCFLNLGNHDLHKLPYNLRFMSLTRVNLDHSTKKICAKHIGHNKFRFLKEFKSILPTAKPPHKKYIFEDAYSRTFSRRKLIFLNTGGEATLRVKNYLNPRTLLFMFRNIMGNPLPAHGLSKKQLTFVKDELEKTQEKEVFIFLHCPPFFSYQVLKEDITLNLKKYTRTLKKHALRDHFFVNNNKRFIKLLKENPKNTFVITSHTHEEKCYLLNKETLVLHECDMQEVNKKRRNAKFVKFISTLPLGSMSHRENKKVGLIVVNDRSIRYKVTQNFNKT